ncbi:MAG: PriCT-2 domain-containing protein, partial [Selenomonadaceae bacterium]|nr:PriCT-2 domain-containing protein [Selenomonadaceae bacterium]
MNNSKQDYSTKGRDNQSRVAQAQLFFDSLFGNVTGEHWGYLWTATQDNRHHMTYPFKVTDAEQRAQMGKRAIELSDAGLQVYFGVNLIDFKPSPYERSKNATVAIQVAIICDIDIEGGTHEQSDKKIYAPDFDTAKSFLPFTPSLIVNSGYGIHAYLILAEPLTITDDNRQAANRRNVGFIKVIRSRAGDCGKTADGVGDLARVLRVPGTFNYKLGIKDDAPLCRIVEANDVRFTPADLDERIAALLPKPQESPPQPTTKNPPPRRFDDRDDLDKPTEQERAIAMLPFVDGGDHDRWVHVGMILKANGNTLSDWDTWSATQPNYTPDKPGYSCAEKWATFPDTCAMSIATLHEWAIEGGYSEKDFLREWYAQHPNSGSYHRVAQSSDLTTKDKIPDCPVDLILPRDVLFNEAGITLVESRKGDEPRYITAAITPIVPTKILRDETSGLVQYELAILTQGKWRRHVVDGRTIQSPRCVDKLANFGALI